MKTKVVLFSDVATMSRHVHELFMPLSTMAIATVLQSRGYEAVVIDVQVEPEWQSRLRAHLNEALMLGVSSLTRPSIYAVLDAVAIAREQTPDLPIVEAFRSSASQGLRRHWSKVFRSSADDRFLDVALGRKYKHELYGASRARTGDLLGAIQALSQLSYSPTGATL